MCSPTLKPKNHVQWKSVWTCPNPRSQQAVVLSIGRPLKWDGWLHASLHRITEYSVCPIAAASMGVWPTPKTRPLLRFELCGLLPKVTHTLSEHPKHSDRVRAGSGSDAFWCLIYWLAFQVCWVTVLATGQPTNQQGHPPCVGIEIMMNLNYCRQL